MANTKDFVIKNALDISEGITLSGGGTVTTTVGDGFGVTRPLRNFFNPAECSAANAIEMKPDGTKMFLTSTSADALFQYTLSTAFDVYTATYDTVTFDYTTQAANAADAFFKSDGTKVFLCGSSENEIFQYSLSTAWDLSTMSYDSKSLDVSSEGTSPESIAFNSDGTKAFVITHSNDTIFQYSLTTAWDISTASYDSVSFALPAGNPQQIRFNSDGTYLYYLEYYCLHQYKTSSAYDISSLNLEATSNFNKRGAGFCFGDDRYVYITEIDDDRILTFEAGDTVDLDLSTSTNFSITTDQNVVVSFSNPADDQIFQVEITQQGAYTNFANAVRSGEYSLATYETAPKGQAFKPDGTRYYFAGTSGDDVTEFKLDVPWDVSSVTGTPATATIHGQGLNPQTVVFSPDGLNMYVVHSSNDTVFQYRLFTPWDLSSSNYAGKSFSFAGQDTTPQDIKFNADGTKMFMLGSIGDDINSYSLSTAYDVSTATFDNVTFSISGYEQSETTPNSFDFVSGGRYMVVCGQADDVIQVFKLSTPYDISTATFNFTTLEQGAINPNGIIARPDHGTLFLINNSDAVYALTFVGEMSIAWPSNVQWQTNAGEAGLIGNETRVYSFYTPDGGTTYYGWLSEKSGD